MVTTSRGLFAVDEDATSHYRCSSSFRHLLSENKTKNKNKPKLFGRQGGAAHCVTDFSHVSCFPRTESQTTQLLSCFVSVVCQCVAIINTKTKMSDTEAASSSSDPNNTTADSNIQENVTKNDPFVEPEKKRRRVSQSIDCGKNKLEERLGGILCCAVCLDLPKAAVYQVSCVFLIYIIYIYYKTLMVLLTAS